MDVHKTSSSLNYILNYNSIRNMSVVFWPNTFGAYDVGLRTTRSFYAYLGDSGFTLKHPNFLKLLLKTFNVY